MDIKATILIVSALTLGLVAAPSIGNFSTIANAKKNSDSSTSAGSSSSSSSGGGASSSSSSSSATSPTLTSKEMKQLTSCLNTQNKAGALNHNAVTTCLDQAKGIAPLTTTGAGAAASSGASGSGAGAGAGAGAGGAAAGGTA
jgi:cytoskeletal protein RodZ